MSRAGPRPNALTLCLVGLEMDDSYWTRLSAGGPWLADRGIRDQPKLVWTLVDPALGQNTSHRSLKISQGCALAVDLRISEIRR